MRRIILTALSLVFFVSFTACNKQEEKKAIETPAALSDEKVELKSYNRSNDLMNELYKELVEQSPELKRLEDNLNAYYGKPNEIHQLFDTYNSKSNSFYSSAEYASTAINDSLLRQKINRILTKSKAQQEKKSAGIKALLNAIDKKDVSIKDRHVELKIMLTLPIIEKFQNENLPSQGEFKALIKEQAQLIKQTDSICPKY